MRLEDLVIGVKYIVDSERRVGVFHSIDPDTGGIFFKIDQTHPYMEYGGLVGFVTIKLVEPLPDEPRDPTN